MRVNLFCSLTKDDTKIIENGLNVGVDRGVEFLLNNELPINIAIGDFDSISEEHFKLMQEKAEEIISLNPVKDASDLDHALDYFISLGYQKFHIYGALNGRADHHFANIMLLGKYREAEIAFVDENNNISLLLPGVHKIAKENFKYLSLFALKTAHLTVKGVKYPLNNYKMMRFHAIGVSNEILKETCEVEVHDGLVLVIKSNDAK